MTMRIAATIRQYLLGSAFRKGATFLTVLTLASYVLGLVRDILFARTFGASRLLDIYNAAFIIPDLLLNIFIAGALTAAFVPVFTHLLAHQEEREAEKVATTMLTAAPLTMFVIGLAAFIFMPQLARIVAPGFSPDELALLIRMSRLMLLSPLIFAVSNTLGNILISYEQFVGYGLSPILYNLGIIVGIPLALAFGPIGLVWGVLAGAAGHLAARLIAIARNGFRLAWPPDFRNRNFLSIVPLMLQRMAGQPIEQLIFSVFTNIASTLGVGSVVVISFARNFQSVPVSLFGISFATAVFASLSRKAAIRERSGFLYHFKQTAIALALTTGISAVFFYFFGEWVIRLFFGGGRFAEADIVRTGQVLAMFAFAIPAEAFIHLVRRSFYALKDTWTPILVTLPGLGAIAILSKLLVPRWGLIAMPGTFAAVFTLEVLILLFLLFRKLRAWQ